MPGTALAGYFDLKGRKTTLSRELRGAVATFLTMAYIVAVNPDILAGAGVDRNAAVACTAAAAAVCSLLMGLFGRFPLAMASGMGLNAVAVYQITPLLGNDWRKAMGLLVLDGLLICVLVVCGLREAIMNAIPRDLRRAIGAGIGLFIALIGAVNARLIVVPPGTIAALQHGPTTPPMPPVTYGSLHDPETVVALIGLLITAVLVARRVTGAILLGIVITTAIAFPFGVAHWSSDFHPFQLPSFALVAQADVLGVLNVSVLPMGLAFLLVDFFDSIGTVTALSEQAQLYDERGNIPKLRNILFVDGLGAAIGGFFGVSSVTGYIESAAGIAEGARTGLHSVFVALFFALAIFAAPLVAMVPLAATAPALILVGFLMASQITAIDFKDPEIGIPAFVTLVLLPFTYSIAHGVGYGFITFVAIKVLSGKFRQVHVLMYASALLFAVYFAWGGA